MPDLTRSAYIFLGAGTGGLLRYWLDGWVQNWWGPTFPMGTLVVNISGCLAAGFLVSLWTGPMLVRDDLRAAILIGLLGGYTTFSTFGRETWALIHDGQWCRAGVYVLGTVILSLAAVWAGSALAGRLYGPGAP
jgi:CrcB protein